MGTQRMNGSDPGLQLPPQLAHERQQQIQQFLQVKQLRDGIALQIFTASAAKRVNADIGTLRKAAADSIVCAQVFLETAEMVPAGFFSGATDA
jgi:hypothetical protein